ncbi:MAG: hypothetical protein ACOYW3_12155 [Bacteroidota bacterium]
MILVTGSNPDLAGETCDFLVAEGFNVLFQPDCALAFQQAVQEKPSLVVISYPEEKMECMQFMQKLRHTPGIEKTPLVVMSMHERDHHTFPIQPGCFYNDHGDLLTKVRGLLS